jgi:hypothetical protein
MTTPSAHEPYKRLARRALIGEGSIPAMSDWEVFLHGFSDTNQRGSSRDIYDCLINLFPTPESVLAWPKFDSETGEPLDLPETGGCANLGTRRGAATWIRGNADPTAWRKIRSLMRCKDRHGRQIPGRQELARDFSDGSRLRRDGTREHPGGLNFQLRQAIQGAGMKGADMHLLWGGCEVPVIDIQMMRLISPHVIGMSFEENARQKLEKKIEAGGALNISGVEPIATRRVLATDEIDSGLRRNITAMEQEEAARIQGDKKQYEIWRNVAYELADKEGMPANEWHVANWLEFRPPTTRLGRGDPDRDLRSRTRAEIDRDKERLEFNIKFIEGTFAPTKFPDAPAEWPLPNDRYPRRERGKRLAQMEAEGLSPEEMVARERSLYPQERLTTRVVIEQLDYFHREQERYETPSAEQHEFQEGIDPYIFLPLYWGARDRGEESFMYGGQQVLVAFARYLVEAAGWKDLTPEDLEGEQGTPEASIDCHLEHWYHPPGKGRHANPKCRLGHWPHPPRSKRVRVKPDTGEVIVSRYQEETRSAFDGITAYANDIMELV